MPWLLLVIAGILEVVWALSLKSTRGFTRPGPSVLTLAAMGVSFYLLSLALRSLPAGTGYAVWVGIGAAGTAIIGMAFLGEPRTLARVVSIALILAGVIGLRLTER
ncbi:MAG: quaternary ammonium compound efflux SMR transporter SugE [Acidobacteria bacterium]|nr:quaternary ammonium compound efflux SMR transporter SugE [Acidobacteriota bacterium]